MTREERKAEFDRLFESIPGTNIERIRKVVSILHCKENTVRIWRMQNPPRVPPEPEIGRLRDVLEPKNRRKARK